MKRNTLLYKLFYTYECNFVLYRYIVLRIFKFKSFAYTYSKYPFINVKRNYIHTHIKILYVAEYYISF